jgi:hypothetical protein
MPRQRPASTSRREFLASAAGVAAASLAAPAVIAEQKSDSAPRTGQGEFQFEVQHDWAQLPDKYHWQTTHGVALDRDGFLYVIHEGREELKDHPSIFVFDPEGRFVRAFGSQFQGGGHGIEVRQEGNDQFLYVSAYQQCKTFAKMNLKGEIVWQKFAPMKSGVYAEGEDTNPKKVWGRDRFMPTNFAFLADGDFLLTDGYGSYYVHRYDRDGNWKSQFGGPGDGSGKFDTPHGICFDQRPGRDPAAVICDRAHNTLQFLSLDGKYISTLEGFGLPANAETSGDLLVVPELVGCVSLLNSRNEVVARLCDDAERIRADKKFEIRGNPQAWKPGRFVHPHDACFDPRGNLFVAEWVATGRVTRLKRLA